MLRTSELWGAGNDLHRLVPSRSRGLGAAPNVEGRRTTLSLGFKFQGSGFGFGVWGLGFGLGLGFGFRA